MTLRRVVALAQALTMIMLLAPGPHSVGPALVEAAFQRPLAEETTIYDAAGRGIGCQAGTRRYKGPGLPKDPPWPPGAEPTPSPEPSPLDDPAASAEAESTPDPSTAPAAAVPMALVAATDVRLAQADLETALETEPAPRAGRMLEGIDVSHHNGDIDYTKVKEAGHRFVFIKATQDNDFIDPMFPTNLARARAVGLAAGAYHFFDYTLDGKSQADHFIDRVEAADGIDGALPPVVDVECWAPIGASIHAVSAARLRDFVKRVYQRTGRMPMVYTSVHMWREVVGNAEGFEDLPLWAACWSCDPPPSLAPGWDDWAFWQTGTTRIPGVGRLDGNYFDGSGRDLDSLKLRPFSIESGATVAGGRQVGLDLGGRDATHIRTSLDGETWTKWRRIGSAPTAPIPAGEGEHTIYAQLRNGPGLRSPVFSDSVFVDGTPPEMSPPVVSLREGAMGAGAASIPVWVRWDARDTTSGLTDGAVSIDCGASLTGRTEVPASAAPGESATHDAEAMLFPETSCKVTAITRDGVGNTARDSAAGIETAIGPADPDSGIGAEQVGVIARRGPDAGRAAVLVDGTAVALLDLYAPEPSGPQIVFVTDIAGGAVVAVEPTGTADPASTGTTVIIDGYATLSR